MIKIAYNKEKSERDGKMEEKKTVKNVRQTKTQLFWEIVRFLLVGGVATLCDYIVFYIFRQWLLPNHLLNTAAWDIFSLILATALGFIVGLLVNWVLSVHFVFRAVRDERQARSRKSFMLFTIIGIIGLIITELGVVLLVQIFPAVTLFGVESFLALPWSEWIAKIVMTCIVLVWNYLGRKIFIFKG